MKTRLPVLLLLFFLANLLSAQVYLDSTASVQERVDDLIGRMTLEEKLGQMIQADHKAIQSMDDMLTYHIGSILSGGGSDPDNGNTALDWANLYDQFQSKALQSRLQIPMIYGIDAVHGHSNVVGAVIFPHNIGLGATGDSALVGKTARITAIEMAATGADWTFAPCVAVPRNERWGRTYEGFGETPELASFYGAAAVRGFQTSQLDHLTSVVACAKHYLGDGGTADGDDQGNTQLTEAELRAIHMPGYLAAIENDVKTVMVSYSSWNGQKMHGHEYMVNQVLKGELGFEGFVVSDWAGIDQLPGDYRSDIKTSINAGLDMIMVPNNYVDFYNNLKSLVDANEIPLSRIDDAVKRILAVKFESGLFEHPYATRSLLSVVGSAEHRAVGREAVRKSMVMLKKTDNILPLPKSGAKILVAGRHANNMGLQCGGWTIQWQGADGNITEGTTILQGIQNAVSGTEIVYSEDGSYNGDDIDYAVVVIGEKPYAEGDGDRDDLNLTRDDNSLVRELKNRGIPVITILISGRPMIINPVLHSSDVFFAAWLPGTEGDGIADNLFGDYTPSGLLPMSWPANMEQIPVNTGDAEYYPLFPYQYGLTSISNSQPGSAPVIESAMVTENGKSIEIAFNKSMNNPQNTTAQFEVVINGGTPVTTSTFALSEGDSKRIVVQLDEEVIQGDVLQLAYVSGNLKAEDGGTLAPVSSVEVINYLSYVPQVFMLPGKVEAEDYSDMFGVEIENTSDVGGGLNVGWIDNGDWLEYQCRTQFAGTYFVKFRIASESTQGKIKFSANGSELFQQSLPVTGGWQNWTTATSLADLEAGDLTLRLDALTGGFNLNWIDITVLTDVEDEISHATTFSLAQNYPNPFNPATMIEYSLESRGIVTLRIYDVLGREINQLVNREQPAGTYKVSFDASGLTSGIYFYELSVKGTNGESYRATNKMILMK